jgi:hypothetical protein
MANRKPASAVDRLPLDFAEARKQGPTTADYTGATAADLAIPSLPPGEQEARSAAAVRYLLRHDAADIVDVLGLSEPVVPPARITLKSVSCPQCRAAVGIVCVSKGGSTYRHGHQARRLQARELRKAAA